MWAWALYDWANSAFATTVLAGFFPVFFKQYWSAGSPPELSTYWLGVGSAAASAAVLILSPTLGALADQLGRRKVFLAAFTGLGIASTVGLFWVSEGAWGVALLLFGLGSVGFFGGLTFYDALLVHVAPRHGLDRVSALGYALGYIGGGLLLALNVAMSLQPAWFGLADASAAVRWSFLSVGLWWLVFSIPLFRLVREPRGEFAGVLRAITPAWRALLATFHEIRGRREVWLFLLAYWLYIDAVHTIIRMAVDVGVALGFPANSLIVALLLVQFLGFPAALLFGYLGVRIGTRTAIFAGLAVYCGVTAWAYHLQHLWQFYAMAAAIALVQGGVQALSRSYFARMVPPERSGEWFGFFNMLGKFAAVLGPLLVGVTALWFGSNRLGILSLLILLVAGMVCLLLVRPRTVPD